MSNYYNPATKEIKTKIELSNLYNASFAEVMEEYIDGEDKWYLIHNGEVPVTSYTTKVVKGSIQLIDGVYTQTYELEEKYQAVLEVETRRIRDNYLSEYVDNQFKNPLQWAELSDDEKHSYVAYRRYLLDYTKNDNWWKQEPKMFGMWKIEVQDADTITDDNNVI